MIHGSDLSSIFTTAAQRGRQFRCGCTLQASYVPSDAGRRWERDLRAADGPRP